MTVIGDAFIRVRPDTDGFKQEADKGIGDALKGAGGMAAAALASAGAAAVAFGATAVNSFASFDKGMKEVFTLMPGLSQSAMGDMTQQVKDFSKEFAVLPEDVVPALYQSLSSGIPAQNVFEFMTAAQKAAKGGVTELETAVDGISSVVNAYGSDVLGATKASDLMFTAVKLGKTTFEELSQSLFNVTPIASSLGVNFGDVTGALAAMTAQGVPTKVATTQLRQMFVELSKEGTATSDTFKEIAGVGFKEFIAKGGDTQGALKLLEQYAKDTGLGVNDLFGSVEAGSAALALTGKGTDRFTDALAGMATSAGATEGAFDTMNEGVSRGLDSLKADFQLLKIDIGEALAPVATILVEVLGEAMKIVGPVLGQLAGALAPIVSGLLSKLSPLIAQIAGNLAPVFDALGVVIEAIPWDSVSIAIGFIMDAVQALLPPLQAALMPVLEVIGTLLPPIAAVFATIAQVAGSILTPVIEALAPLFVELAEIVDSVLNDAMESIIPVLEEIAPLFGEAIVQAVSTLIPLILELVQAFLPLLPPILELVEALLPVILDLFTTLMPVVTSVIGALVSLATHALKPIISILSELIGWVTDVVSAFGDWWNGLDGFWKNVQHWVENIEGALGSVIDTVGGWVEATFGAIKEFIGGVWDSIKGIINHIIKAWNGLQFTIPEMDPLGDWGPSVGPWTIGLPDIPLLSTGAVVRGGQLAVIGDRPDGEAVLTRPQLNDLISWAGSNSVGTGSGGGVHFHGPVSFGTDQREAVSELDWWVRYKVGATA